MTMFRAVLAALLILPMLAWADPAEVVGVLDGDVNATIRPQVTGYLVKQNYREGDFVKKGQVLFEIDPRTFKAAVDQANGVRAQQQANYTTASAALARVKPLAAKNALSQKDLDDATGNDLAAHAALDQANAALETAKLNLSFTKITSPINGVAGIAKAQIGDLLSPGAQEELTTVSTLDPIKVYINISEREYLKFIERNPDGRPENVPLSLILIDEVDNAYGDTYSGAVSAHSLLPRWSVRRWGLAMTALCTALALVLPMHSLEPFLLLLSSVFVPLFGVILGRLAFGANPPALLASARPVNAVPVVLWLLGIAMYHLAPKVVPGLGSALPTLAVSFVLAWVTRPRQA